MCNDKENNNNNNKKKKNNNNKEKQKIDILCKYCNGNHIRLHGTSNNGKKRYRCMECNRPLV